MEATQFLIYFLNGVTYTMWIFLLSSGLSFILGVLRILNLAHGSLFMFGAYLGWQSVSWLGSFWYALLISPLAIAAFGAGVEYLLLRRIYERHITYQLLLTFGLLLVINDLVKFIWGLAYKSISEPALLLGPVTFLGIEYPKYNIFVILVGALVAGLMWIFLSRTRLGKIIRASSMDRETATTLGIRVPMLYTLVFAIGSGLGALAGCLAGPLMSITLDLAVETVVKAFVIVVVGGLGSIPGAFIASLLIGEVSSFGIVIFPQFEMAFMFILMALILILRPEGLMGSKEG